MEIAEFVEDFYLVSNQYYPDRINLRFKDSNRVSSLMNSKELKKLAKELFKIADRMESYGHTT